MLSSLADKIEVWDMVGWLTEPPHQDAKSFDELCLSPQASKDISEEVPLEGDLVT